MLLNQRITIELSNDESREFLELLRSCKKLFTEQQRFLVLQGNSPPQQETSDIIDIVDACRLTHLSKQTIYCLKWAGKIPVLPKRPGSKKLLFSRTAILQWINGTNKANQHGGHNCL